MSMTTQPELLLTLIAKRTERLRLLASDLEQSQQALVRLDLDAIYDHNARQQSLCGEIQTLDSELKPLVNLEALSVDLNTLHAALSPDDRQRLFVVVTEHESARADLKRLGQVQADLLVRLQRSGRIFLNLLANSTGTYQAPRFQRVGRMTESSNG